jgi:hypothetical protein
MARTNRTQRPRNGNRAATSAAIRVIAGQIQRLSDAEVYALTLSGDRNVRRIADRIAHKRAEQYALNH